MTKNNKRMRYVMKINFQSLVYFVTFSCEIICFSLIVAIEMYVFHILYFYILEKIKFYFYILRKKLDMVLTLYVRQLDHVVVDS